jgi:DNA-binding NtrC family response regulator
MTWGIRQRRPTLLVVEDHGQIRRMIPRIVGRLGWRTRDAERAEEALGELESEPVDLVISDIRLPGMNGCRLIREIAKRWPETRCMLITAYVTMDMAGCVDSMPILQKPFTFEALEEKITRVMSAPPWRPPPEGL